MTNYSRQETGENNPVLVFLAQRQRQLERIRQQEETEDEYDNSDTEVLSESWGTSEDSISSDSSDEDVDEEDSFQAGSSENGLLGERTGLLREAYGEKRKFSPDYLSFRALNVPGCYADIDSVSMVVPLLSVGTMLNGNNRVAIRTGKQWLRKPKVVEDLSVTHEDFGLAEEDCVSSPCSRETFNFTVGELQIQGKQHMQLQMLLLSPDLSGNKRDYKGLRAVFLEALERTWNLRRWEGKGDEDLQWNPEGQEEETLNVSFETAHSRLVAFKYRKQHMESCLVELTMFMAFIRSFHSELREVLLEKGFESAPTYQQTPMMISGTNWKDITREFCRDSSAIQSAPKFEKGLKGVGSVLHWSKIMDHAIYLRVDGCLEFNPSRESFIFFGCEQPAFAGSKQHRRWGVSGLIGGITREAMLMHPVNDFEEDGQNETFSDWQRNRPGAWFEHVGLNLYEAHVRNTLITPGSGLLRYQPKGFLDAGGISSSLYDVLEKHMEALELCTSPCEATHNSVRLEAKFVVKSGSLATPGVRGGDFCTNLANIMALSTERIADNAKFVELQTEDLTFYLDRLKNAVREALQDAAEAVIRNENVLDLSAVKSFALQCQGVKTILSAFAFGHSFEKYGSILERSIHCNGLIRPYDKDDEEDIPKGFLPEVASKNDENTGCSLRGNPALERVIGYEAMFYIHYMGLIPKPIRKAELDKCADVIMASLWRQAILKQDSVNNKHSVARWVNFDSHFLNPEKRTKVIEDELVKEEGRWKKEEQHVSGAKLIECIMDGRGNWIFQRIIRAIIKAGENSRLLEFTSEDVKDAMVRRIGEYIPTPANCSGTSTSRRRKRNSLSNRTTSFWKRKGSLTCVIPSSFQSNMLGIPSGMTHPEMSMEMLPYMPQDYTITEIFPSPEEVAYWLTASEAMKRQNHSWQALSRAQGWGFEYRSIETYYTFKRQKLAFDNRKDNVKNQREGKWVKLFKSQVYKRKEAHFKKNGFSPEDAARNRSRFNRIIASTTTDIAPVYVP